MKKKSMSVSLTLVAFFTLFTVTLFTPPTTHAKEITSSENNIIFAPDQRYHEVTFTSSSAGKSNYYFDGKIDGERYVGTLNKIKEHYIPEIGYRTIYGGTVYIVR